MKPRRTPASNQVFRLDGGTEDNDLWVERTVDGHGSAVICSVWVPSHFERLQLAGHCNLELIVWGAEHPPVALVVTEVQPGRPAA